jgi:tetratricopeptide (TPR) repeat protein
MMIAKKYMLIYVLALFNAAISAKWIDESIHLVMNTRFDEAEHIFKKHIAEGDSSLGVWFYYSSMLNSQMVHHENGLNPEKFLHILNKVIHKADESLRFIDRSDSTAIAKVFFYKGSALGYLSFYQGQIGKYFSALNNGFKTVEQLNMALAYDSTLYDAWLGIGVYQYWKSVRLKSISWMPFMEDQREEGIRNVKKSIQYAPRSRYLAMHQLIYILTAEKRFKEAQQYAKEVIAIFPQSSFMRWAHAHTYFMAHENEEALLSFQQLKKLLKNDPATNPNHLVQVEAHTADIFNRMGMRDSCRAHSQTALKLSLNILLSEKGRIAVEKAIRLNVSQE